jgi:hemerythrin HHE cation binding domain-containing protein
MATIDLGWTAPAHRLDAGAARRGILWQHDRIRGLLEKARTVADARLGGDATPEAVADAVSDLHSIIEVHLAFEEAVLVPLLREDLPEGPGRADRMLDEHQRQRRMLASIHSEAYKQPELPALAVKLGFLASWFLADMAEEERELTMLRPAA